jgi:hypothetical protein
MLLDMDRLRAHDLEEARSRTPAEKLGLALEAMRTGIRLKRASLRVRFPQASAGEIEERLQRWLERVDE